VLREVAAKTIGVEIGRRSLGRAGQNERDRCEPKTSHSRMDIAKLFQIWIARYGEVALNCP